ncbi:hypothetical protein YC2023_052209 [Brassica napus]
MEESNDQGRLITVREPLSSHVWDSKREGMSCVIFHGPHPYIFVAQCHDELKERRRDSPYSLRTEIFSPG